MPRKARLDAPGTLHHVILRGIEKRRIVRDNRDRRDFVDRMGTLAQETETPLYAWALMTNHAHILLRSGSFGLSTFMRRLLTGYAVNFNLRHRRHGHLFQNRYKSIVCEEDPYFKELVRYIHLNPLRAGLVQSLSILDRYEWCGHAAVVGQREHSWQDTDYVLEFFADRKTAARERYRKFVEKGVAEGRKPELVGGGLIRSMGGWSVVKSLRRGERTEKGDERILGSSEFVLQLLCEAEPDICYQLPRKKQEDVADNLIEKACRENGIDPAALTAGSRSRKLSALRHELADGLVNELGLSMAEAARRLGVTTSAISNVLRRKCIK
ncbi:MAG: transposase [Desulfobacterales bacterium]|nr:transposase [Desulfobacterales bacterium]